MSLRILRSVVLATSALAMTGIVAAACGGTKFTAVVDDGGAGADGSVDDSGATADGSTTSDAGAPDGASVDAGALSTCDKCSFSNSTCCLTPTGSSNQYTAQCVQGSQCPSGGGKPPTALHCLRKSDCPGTTDVCCISKNGDQAASQCSSATACKSGNGQILCVVGGGSQQCLLAGGTTQCLTSDNGNYNITAPLGLCLAP